MSVILIPLNNDRLPAKKFMTDKLAEQISISDVFLKNKEIIESHPLFIVFSKLSLTEQKKTFEGYMSEELSARLETEIKQNSPRRSRSTTNRRYSPRFNTLAYSRTLVPSLAGGAFGEVGSILGTIMFIIFIILLLRPNIFNSIMTTSDAQLNALQNKIQIMTNISTDKNKDRLVYFVITSNIDNYFLKISPSEVITNKQESRQYDIHELNTADVGEYVYECLIYEEMNIPTGVQYQDRDLNSYVSEIVDWNIKEIIESTNNFVVDLEGEQIDLNTVSSTYEGLNMELCESILNNGWNYPSPDNNYCYSLVKAYDGFTTFRDYLNDRSFGNLMQIFSNVCNILRLFYRKNHFCHWDLHGDNLLVNGMTGEIKLFDFDLSEVHRSISSIRDGRIEFITDPRIIVKDQLGHLYDYYRLIENIYYNNDLKMFFFNIIGSSDEREIIRYFQNYGALHPSQGMVYTYQEMQAYRTLVDEKRYTQLQLQAQAPTQTRAIENAHVEAKYYEYFYNTIIFFNKIQ
jgi:hypothetical protein